MPLFLDGRLELTQGDPTRLDVDAVSDHLDAARELLDG
jgi:hypothetical protein